MKTTPDDENTIPAGSPIRLHRYVVGLMVFWTVAIVIVFAWEISDERQQALMETRNNTSNMWQKENAIFRWAAAHLDTVVAKPVAASSKPAAPSAEALTDPASIMRAILKMDNELPTPYGRIISLKTTNAKYVPDPWETTAMQAIAAGRPEYDSTETFNGERVMRLVRPLTNEPSCLACHRDLKLGEPHGGLSVALPLAPVWAEHEPEIVHRVIGYGGMWLLGLGGIAFFSRHLSHHVRRRHAAETKLREANELLEHRVAERTAELATANDDLQNEVVERRQAEHWLLESEQRFRGFFEQGLVGMAILSADMDWVEVNDRLCRMLGYTEDELMMKTWKELGHPDDLVAEEPQFRRLMTGIVRGFVIDRRFLRKDGKFLHVGLSAHCLKKPDETIDTLLIVVRESAVSV